MKNIVIIGGGYAGVLTAKDLYKDLKKYVKKEEVSITLIDKNPFHTLLTELHEVSFDRATNESIKVYYKDIFAKSLVNFEQDFIEDIDYSKKTVKGQKDTYKYDYLVEATGSKPCYFGIKGAEEFTYPMWSYKDAVKLKEVVITNFNKAEVELDEAKRRKLLTFVVVGAGFTGVEVIGELNEWIKCSLIHKYKTIKKEEIRVINIDGSDRILNAFGEKAAFKAHRYMEKVGIEIITSSFVKEVTKDSVTYGEGNTIYSDCMIWTSGIMCEPIKRDKYAHERSGRVEIDTDGSKKGSKNVYILGDLMNYVPETLGRPLPQMVENCEAIAPIVAHNIAVKIKGKGKVKEYDPAFHGAMACIGGKYGVAELKFGKFTINQAGFMAMLTKHMINMLYFFQAAGVSKVWHYIKEEFFYVKDRRSFVGGNLAAKSPSIYLVPLRIWIGWYWFAQGYPKVFNKLQDGFTSVCSNTEMFSGKLAQYKDYGPVCRAVAPDGEAAFNTKFGIGQAVADTASGASAAAEAAPQAAETTAQAATTAADAASGASAAVDAGQSAGQTAVDVATSGGHDVAHHASNIFVWGNDFIQSLAPAGSDFGLNYDLHILPHFITNLIDFMMNSMAPMMGPWEWLIDFIMAFGELAIGFMLIIGLFIPLAAIGLLILCIMIGMGSYASFGGVVFGIFVSACTAIALLGFGQTDWQPLSVDYFLGKYYPNILKIGNKKKKNK